MTEEFEIIERFKNSKELKKSFDLWVLDFDIKNAVGLRPGWDGFADSIQYDLYNFIKKCD